MLEIEEDEEVPIILGRPFLATAGIVTDFRDGSSKFHVGDECVEFTFPKNYKSLVFFDHVFTIDVLEKLTKTYSVVNHSQDLVDTCLRDAGTNEEDKSTRGKIEVVTSMSPITINEKDGGNCKETEVYDAENILGALFDQSLLVDTSHDNNGHAEM